MATLTNFDANQVDPAAQFDPIPAGKYIAVITESEFKPTRAGDGQYLELTFQIVDGAHRGRLVWSRLNLENRNDTTVKLARGELSSICRAIGVMQPRDSIELHNIPLEITVGLKRRDDSGEFKNVIRGYAKRSPAPGSGSAGVATACASSGGVARASGAGAVSAPPWKR